MPTWHVLEWLDGFVGQWERLPHPRPVFYTDLGPNGQADVPRFPYWLMWLGTTWGQEWCDTGVRVWAVCWLNEASRAGFHVVLEDGRAFMLAPPIPQPCGGRRRRVLEVRGFASTLAASQGARD